MLKTAKKEHGELDSLPRFTTHFLVKVEHLILLSRI